MEKVDVVCPFCGCLCDDLVVTVDGGHVTDIKNGCVVSRSKFMNHGKHRVSSATAHNEKKNIQEAVDAAIKILSHSKRPLIYGLSSTECGAISKAIEIAEVTGGVVDNTASVCHGPTILALQQVGESKASLGEIMNRADMVVDRKSVV